MIYLFKLVIFYSCSQLPDGNFPSNPTKFALLYFPVFVWKKQHQISHEIPINSYKFHWKKPSPWPTCSMAHSSGGASTTSAGDRMVPIQWDWMVFVHGNWMEIDWDFMEMEWDLYCWYFGILWAFQQQEINKDLEQLRISTRSCWGEQRRSHTTQLSVAWRGWWRQRASPWSFPGSGNGNGGCTGFTTKNDNSMWEMMINWSTTEFWDILGLSHNFQSKKIVTQLTGNALSATGHRIFASLLLWTARKRRDTGRYKTPSVAEIYTTYINIRILKYAQHKANSSNRETSSTSSV